MRFIISFVYWIIVLPLIMLVMFPIDLLIWLATKLFDKNLKLLQFGTNIWGSLFTWLNPFISVEVSGKENVDPNKTYVITPNHSSLMDIPAIHRLFINFKWISKASLRKIPFVGWNMVLNQTVFISRTDPKSQFKMMRDCENHLEIGNSIMIFPEGTRYKGHELGRFRDGGFLLAKKKKCDVLPIAIVDSDIAVEGFTFKKSVKIKVQVLPSIAHDEFKKTRDLRDKVKESIEEAISSL